MLLGIGVSVFAGKIVTDSIYSKTLNFTHKYNVYLPDGYDKSDQKYPVVYLLHGMYGGYSDWAKMGNMKLVADELISSGEACPMVIVMPNAGDCAAASISTPRTPILIHFSVAGYSSEKMSEESTLPTL